MAVSAHKRRFIYTRKAI